jgi:SAM-dependent methyltransferase
MIIRSSAMAFYPLFGKVVFGMVGQCRPKKALFAMHLDVLDLRNFYYRTKLGRVAQRAIRDAVVRMWPAGVGDLVGQTMAGYGFAVPLMRPYLADARRVIGLMPAPQGVMAWPAGMENVSLLVEEAQWPLTTGSVDRLIMMHGLETSEQPSHVLDEVVRVLGPGGRALFIVPSRSGLWARRDGTPFGFGRPYSMGQLEAQLKRHDLTVERSVSALFAPPSGHPFWLGTSDFFERNGRRFAPFLAGGVLMVEVSKQRPPSRSGLVEAVRRPLRVLEGLGQGAPEPALREGMPQDAGAGPDRPHVPAQS